MASLVGIVERIQHHRYYIVYRGARRSVSDHALADVFSEGEAGHRKHRGFEEYGKLGTLFR